MVKTPRTRHSKAQRDPVTIELEPGEVSRLSGDTETVADASASETADLEQEAAQAAEAGTAAELATEWTDPATQPADEPLPHEENPTFDPAPAPEPDSAEPEPKPSGYDFAGNDAAKPEPAPRYPSEDAKSASTWPNAPEPKRSRMPAFAAGLLGGVVALAAGGLLQFAGILGAPGGSGAGTPDLGAVETEIAALKSEIATLKDARAERQATLRPGSTGSRRRWIRSRPMSARCGRRSSPAARAKIPGFRRSMQKSRRSRPRSPVSVRVRAAHRPPKSLRSTRRSPASKRWRSLPAKPVPRSTAGSALSSKACPRCPPRSTRRPGSPRSHSPSLPRR